MRLVLRQVRPFGGAMVDLLLADGHIVGPVETHERGAASIDGRGAVLLPGLHDHHLHILATAARRTSIDLAGLAGADAIATRLRHAAAGVAPGTWLRAVGYDERASGLPDRWCLDAWVPDHPLRLQDRTGALWVLNSAALQVLATTDWPPGCERDASGQPNGRFWREDRWLAAWRPAMMPDIAALGRELASRGVTALTDAGAGNGPTEAAVLAHGHLSGALPQRLTLMGAENLPEGRGYVRGALKLLLDERDPPSLESLAERIRGARASGRAVAAHCVTEVELALYLAALAMAGGARPGDRIEHGGMIVPEAIDEIAGAGLAIVSNPVFLHGRGDRYAETLTPAEQADLYRIASLLRAGVRLAAGSDTPYGDPDPWLSMRSARDRLSAGGRMLSPDERVSAATAMRLHWSNRLDAGAGTPLTPGAAADLILCEGSIRDVLADLSADRVCATIIGGRVVFSRDGAALPRQ